MSKPVAADDVPRLDASPRVRGRNDRPVDAIIKNGVSVAYTVRGPNGDEPSAVEALAKIIAGHSHLAKEKCIAI